MLIVCSTRASLFQSPGSHLKSPRHNVGMCRDKSLVDRGGRNEHAVADRCPQRVNGAVHTGYGIERSKAFAATSATSNCAVSGQRTRRSAYMAAMSVLAGRNAGLPECPANLFSHRGGIGRRCNAEIGQIPSSI